VLINCKDCGKLFNNTIGDICPQCVRGRNEAIAKIDSYAFKNKELTIEKIAENTQIDVAEVRKLVLSGKINSIKTLKAKCEMCGKETNVSTVNFLCAECVTDIKAVQTHTEESVHPLLKKSHSGGMKSRRDI
jgi:ribosomal protein L37E